MRLTVLLLLVGAALGTLAVWNLAKTPRAGPPSGRPNPLLNRSVESVPVQFGEGDGVFVLAFDADEGEPNAAESRALRAAGIGLPRGRERILRVLIWNNRPTPALLGRVTAVEAPFGVRHEAERLDRLATRPGSLALAWSGADSERALAPGSLRTLAFGWPSGVDDTRLYAWQCGEIALAPMVANRNRLLQVLDGRTWPPAFSELVREPPPLSERLLSGAEPSDESTSTTPGQRDGR